MRFPSAPGVFIWIAALAAAAGARAQVPDPVLPSVPELEIVEIEPLSQSAALPFLSPRDAARYRMQRAIAGYRENTDPRPALRGVLQAALLDLTYPAAQYNLAVLSMAAADYDGAVGFLEEVSHLEAAPLRAAAARELPRARLLAKLNREPKGQARQKYDLGLVQTFDKDAATRDRAQRIGLWRKQAAIDGERYEAFAYLGALLADQGDLDAALANLTLAAKYVPLEANPGVDRMLARATKEAQYVAAERTARDAMRLKDYKQAEEFFERAWQAAPDQAGNGLDAAGALLAMDDTAGAVRILVRVRQSPVKDAAARAEAMLKALRSVEPAAERALAAPAAPSKPPAVAWPTGPYERMLPPVVTRETRLLTQPAPKLIEDREAVRLLDAFVVGNAAPPAAPEILDQSSSPLVSGEKPFDEFARAKVDRADTSSPVLLATADRSGVATRGVRTISISSTPAGAEVLLDDEAGPVCATPCELKIAGVKHTLHAVRQGYVAEQLTLTARTPAEWSPELKRERGQVIVDTPEPGAQLLVNDKLAALQMPTRLSLATGVYKLEARSRNGSATSFITIVPDKMLRVTVGR